MRGTRKNGGGGGRTAEDLAPVQLETKVFHTARNTLDTRSLSHRGQRLSLRVAEAPGFWKCNMAINITPAAV